MKGYAQGSGMNLSQVVVPQFGLGNDMLYKLKQAIALDAFDLIVVDSMQAVIPDSVSDHIVLFSSQYILLPFKVDAPGFIAQYNPALLRLASPLAFLALSVPPDIETMTMEANTPIIVITTNSSIKVKAL